MFISLPLACLRFYVSLHSCSLSHSFWLCLSRSRAHATHIDSSKVFFSSLFPSLFFVHLALRADLPAFSLVSHFPTKSESLYLAQKKKFYHSVSTCSSTSFPASRLVVCRLSKHGCGDTCRVGFFFSNTLIH